MPDETGLSFRCARNDECPRGALCALTGLSGEGQCVAGTSECLDRGDPARAVADGAGCSGGVCKAGRCVEPRCGDGVPEGDEACDDANDNPRDGCADCRQQAWDVRLLVGGAVGNREALAFRLTPTALAVDPLGRLFIADSHRAEVLRLEADGTLTTIAGAGGPGLGGDGGPATSAALNVPSGIAVDLAGRIFIADAGNHRVRRVDPDGTIRTIAGKDTDSGIGGFSGDEGPATDAQLDTPTGLAIDDAGRVFVADTGNHRIRRIDRDGTIHTVAGSGPTGFSARPGEGEEAPLGDGGPATSARLVLPRDVAFDAAGSLYIADTSHHRIRRVDADGTITTFVDLTAAPSSPHAIAFDGEGRLLIADSFTDTIVRRAADGTLVILAGNERCDPSEPPRDDGSAQCLPLDVAVDGAGRIFVADSANHRVRAVDGDGRIDTVAGTGSSARQFGDDGPGLSATLGRPAALAVDRSQRVLVVDQLQHRLLALGPDGYVETLVGIGVAGFAGDGADARVAQLAGPSGVAVDADDRILVADTDNHRIRRIEPDGTITTVVGTGAAGFAGDGGPAARAALDRPTGIAIDADGRIFIADTGNRRIRRVDVDGTIVTIAGTGAEPGDAGAAGDGGPATSAALTEPVGVAVTADGSVLIADAGDNRVRRIEGSVITTLAADFSGLSGVAIDANGDALVVERGGNRVLRLAADGTRIPAAGTGLVAEHATRLTPAGASADGGPAVDAALRFPLAVAVDAVGRVLIAESAVSVAPGSARRPPPARVRRIEADGTIATVLGPVHPAGPGAAGQARLYPTQALLPLTNQHLLAVGGFGRVLRIGRDTGDVDVAGGYEEASSADAVRALARFAPLLDDASGAALDPIALAVVVTERGSGSTRVLGLDLDDDGVIDDPARWTHASVPTTLVAPAGITYDALTDTFVVVDEGDHCVRRVGRDGVVAEAIVGRCGAEGVFPGYLARPTHVVRSPTTLALYVADTGNHRVLRVDREGVADVVIGDGSVSSAGEGSPARLFPVNAPRQLALDEFGNLYVASTTKVRMVANVDGDDDADGDDRVVTIFGGGARASFPESDTFCLGAITVGDDGEVFAADACQGFMVRLTSSTTP